MERPDELRGRRAPAVEVAVESGHEGTNALEGLALTPHKVDEFEERVRAINPLVGQIEALEMGRL